MLSSLAIQLLLFPNQWLSSTKSSLKELDTTMPRRPTRTLTDDDGDNAIVSLPTRTISPQPTLPSTRTDYAPRRIVGQQSLFRDFWGSFTSQSTTSHTRNVKKQGKEGSTTPGIKTESSATPDSDNVSAANHTHEIIDVEAPPISSKPQRVISSSADGTQLLNPGAVRAGGLVRQAQGGIPPPRMASVTSSDGDCSASSRPYNYNHHINIEKASEILVDASLVEASLIEESERRDAASFSGPLVDKPILIVNAQQMEDPTICNTFLTNRRLQCALLVMALGLVGAAVATTQTIGQGRDEESNNTLWSVTTSLAPVTTIPTVAPSCMPSERGDVTLEYFVRHVLPNQTQLELHNPESSQSQALEWLNGNTNLETYTTARRLQRFVLATFYFATRGPTWWMNTTSWMSDAHECDWHHSSTVLAIGNETAPTICTEDGFYQVLALADNRYVPHNLSSRRFFGMCVGEVVC
jgi:hypothetical protein